MTPVLAIHDDQEVLLLGFVGIEDEGENWKHEPITYPSVEAVYATHDGRLHSCPLEDIRVVRPNGVWPSGFLDTETRAVLAEARR